MKRLVFCFDGTWNKVTADCPTNVVLVAEMVCPIAQDGIPQIVYYDEGVGTAKSEKFRGGAFGKGMMTNIRDAYLFLLFNYEPGDHIFAFGFSRGAYTARSFVGFIRHAGILNINNANEIDRAIELYKAVYNGAGDDSNEALEFRSKFSSQICVSEWDRDWRIANCKDEHIADFPVLEIKYLGVWDSVAALGLPKFVPGATWYNRKHHKHDVKLTSKVQSARHAVAIDERRILFVPVLWNNINELNALKHKSVFDIDAPYQQKWFPGVHGAVGGGSRDRGLSDQALGWVLKGARKAGLHLRLDGNSRAYTITPDPLAVLQPDPEMRASDKTILGKAKSFCFAADRIGPTDVINVSASARKRWLAVGADLPERRRYRPITLKDVANKIISMENMPDAEGNYKKAMREHIVVKGDTLSSLAKHYLGDPMRYPEIFNANRDLIDDPDEIYAGMVLKIPEA
jgi:uncharacterized protein (DUF2235 family)